MKRMLSGIKPTGQLHLGSYIGALKHFVEYQDEYEMFAFIANLHCITVPQDPETLQKNLIDCVALYLACGLDPKKATIFLQTDVKEHAQLGYIMCCHTYMGLFSSIRISSSSFSVYLVVPGIKISGRIFAWISNTCCNNSLIRGISFVLAFLIFISICYLRNGSKFLSTISILFTTGFLTQLPLANTILTLRKVSKFSRGLSSTTIISASLPASMEPV